MISAGELIYSQPCSAVQTGSPSQQTYRKKARFLTGSGRGPAKFFGGLRARNFMKSPFKNLTSATASREVKNGDLAFFSSFFFSSVDLYTAIVSHLVTLVYM